MSELAATAERLRTVKDACVDFLILWAVDEMMTETCAGDQLWNDLHSSPPDNSSFSKFGRNLDD